MQTYNRDPISSLATALRSPSSREPLTENCFFIVFEVKGKEYAWTVNAADLVVQDLQILEAIKRNAASDLSEIFVHYHAARYSVKKITHDRKISDVITALSKINHTVESLSPEQVKKDIAEALECKIYGGIALKWIITNTGYAYPENPRIQALENCCTTRQPITWQHPHPLLHTVSDLYYHLYPMNAVDSAWLAGLEADTEQTTLAAARMTKLELWLCLLGALIPTMQSLGFILFYDSVITLNPTIITILTLNSLIFFAGILYFICPALNAWQPNPQWEEVIARRFDYFSSIYAPPSPWIGADYGGIVGLGALCLGTAFSLGLANTLAILALMPPNVAHSLAAITCLTCPFFSFFSFPLITHSAKILALAEEGVTYYGRQFAVFFQPAPEHGLHSPLLPPESP